MATYYYVFNISIISFLDISEVIQLQLSLYVFLLGVIFIVGPISYHYIDKVFKNIFDDKEDLILETGARLKFVESEISDISKGLTEDNREKYETMLTQYYEANRRNSRAVSSLNGVKVAGRVLVWTIVIAIALVICLGRALYEAHELKNKSEVEVSMIVNDKPITTSRYYRFIGRTKNFIFFHNYATKVSDLFNNSEVKGLNFKEGIDYSKPPKVVAKPTPEPVK